LACLFLAGFACYSCVSWVREVLKSPSILNEVEMNETRYSPFKFHLQKVFHAGYLVQPSSQATKVTFHIYKKYILAQFALAPTILHFGAESEWIVFDGDPSCMAEMSSSFELVKNEGNGLGLFRRRK